MPKDSRLPSLSIILPVHDEAALVPRALTEAVARQDEWPADVEIIVACNGCTDDSAEVARRFPVTVVEDERSGMSFGKNLGGRRAKHDLLLFWDIDTSFGKGALCDLAAAISGREKVAGGFYTLPDKLYPRSRIFYWIMNTFCRRRKAPPAGAVFITRSLYEELGGLDESIPQGTSSDLVRRACEFGAEFVFVKTTACHTSVRRFEKRGYLRQLLSWRKNINLHAAGNKETLAAREYEVIREEK